MKNNGRNKGKMLTRQGLALLLVAVMLVGYLLPGGVQATEGETEPTVEVTVPETTAPEETQPEETKATEPEATTAPTQPEETVPETTTADTIEGSTTSVYQSYTNKLAELKTQVEALLTEDPQSEGYENRENALWDALGQTESSLGQSKEAGEITAEEYNQLFAELDSVTNLLVGEVEPEEESSSYAYHTDKERIERFHPSFVNWNGGDPDTTKMYDVGSAATETTAATGLYRDIATGLTKLVDFAKDKSNYYLVDKTIPRAYRNIILGRKEAERVETNAKDLRAAFVTDQGVLKGYDGSGIALGTTNDEGTRENVSVVAANQQYYDTICNNYWARYYNIGSIIRDGKEVKVDVKLTLVDYAIRDTAGYLDDDNSKTATLIAFPADGASLGALPGVATNGIEWVEIKYTFYEYETDTPITDLKGSTTYIDIDGMQGVYVEDNTNDFILLTSACHLMHDTVAGQPFIFCHYQHNISTSNLQGAVSECFTTDGTGSITRTLRFNWGGAVNHSDTQLIPMGNLTITKAVNGDYDRDKEYTFEVTLDPSEADDTSAFNGSYGEKVVFNNNVATFKLKAGESVTIEDIDAKVKYTVKELDTANYDVTTSGGTQGTDDAGNVIASGTFKSGETASVTFTNTRKLADVTVSKKVTGNMGDRSKEFTFTVTMTDNGQALGFTTVPAGATYDEDTKSLTFKLSHDEGITLKDIPVDAILTVSETCDGYVASATVNGDNAEIKAENLNAVLTHQVLDTIDDEIVVTNDKTVPIDTGIALDSMPYIVLLVGVAAIGLILFGRKRRVED